MENFDITRPGVAEAVDLARQLLVHCKRHNFPPDTQIMGIAISAEHAYIMGKEYERERIAALLGL